MGAAAGSATGTWGFGGTAVIAAAGLATVFSAFASLHPSTRANVPQPEQRTSAPRAYPSVVKILPHLEHQMWAAMAMTSLRIRGSLRQREWVITA
jgi:hypothetical protein